MFHRISLLLLAVITCITVNKLWAEDTSMMAQIKGGCYEMEMGI